MYKNEKFSFKLMISVNGYTEKPTSKDYNKISFEEKEITISELEQFIKQGYIFSCTYIDKEIKSLFGYKKKERALHTNIIVFDIDNTLLSFDELLVTLKYQPSIAYTTFSHITKGNRYRLLYIFNTPLNQNQYQILYDNIITNIELDNHNRAIYQFYLGSYANCKLINNLIIYNYDDISISNSIKEKPTPYNIQLQMEKRDKVVVEIKDHEYITNFWNLSHKDLIEKYREKYPFFENNLGEANEDIPYITIPENYCCIKRYWFKEKTKLNNGNCVYSNRVCKIKDGNGRRKKLFLNAIVRKYMYPQIEFEHLLHCLANELYYYINNSKDPISKQELYDIAENAYNENIDKYSTMIKQQQTEKRKWIINPQYCIKYNLSAKTVRNMVKGKINNELIGLYYDCSKSLKENLSTFKALNLKVGKSKLYEWCKENNIPTNIKNNQSTKNTVGLYLYNPISAIAG